MAAFTYVRDGGLWADNSQFTAADAAGFDSRIHKALNATDGGVWAPTSVIELGGAGLKVTGPTLLLGGLEVGGDDVFFNTPGTVGFNAGVVINFAGVTSFADHAAFGGTVFHAAAVTFNDQIAAGLVNCLTLTVNGPGNVSGNMAVEGTLTAANSTLSGIVTIPSQFVLGTSDGTSLGVLRAPMQGSGLGRVVPNGQLITSSQIRQTFSPATVQWLNIPAGLFGASTGTFTTVISDANCLDGDSIGVTNQDTAQDAFVQDPAGGITTVKAFSWNRYMRFNGAWSRIQAGSFNPHGVSD